MRAQLPSFIDKKLFLHAIVESFMKLNPATLVKNPVMLLVEICALITTFISVRGIFYPSAESIVFTGTISLWLWLTVLFSNFAEALAERRGKARAEELTKIRSDTVAKRLRVPEFGAEFDTVRSKELAKGDIIEVDAGEIVPSDGDVINGKAFVDESVITGESAPVLREFGGDRSAVTGGTKVISDKLLIRVSVNPGETFLDRIIGMVESAKRRKSPNELALDVLIISLTLLFILVCINIYAISAYSVSSASKGTQISITVLICIFVCLAPTTIAALLSAIAISGMDRLFKKNVVALSGKAIESAGDVDILLLDKTGTITVGNRAAVDIIPCGANQPEDVARAAFYASVADKTPEGRSITELTEKAHNFSLKDLRGEMKIIPFTAATRISGSQIGGSTYLKGASDEIIKASIREGKEIPADVTDKVDSIAKTGGTPLLVSMDGAVLGVIHLKDIVKEGIKDRLHRLRTSGIKSIMVTGDNPLTAAAIASEAGTDEFVAQAKPEDKKELIHKYHREGFTVAMIGDGTNDAPALAQADVAVAMQTGTQAAREAANIIDLDSNPTRLIDIVEIGKEMLITRGSLTTFSIANDIAKYFAIIPAALSSVYPSLEALNIMRLSDPYSAVVSAVIFNAIIIPLLIPLALKGVGYRAMSAKKLLMMNILIFGLGGVIAPFIGIKLIDMGVSHFI